MKNEKMKQGTLSLLSVRLGMDIDLCERIEFLFKQGDVEKEYFFPSDDVIQKSGRTLDFIWTEDEKARFQPNMPIELDTRITLKDSPYQPDTCITSFEMSRTLFANRQPM